MKIITGDLIKLAHEGHFDVIVHQCNCFHNFGACIALQIMRQFPKAYEIDKKTPYGDRGKLGTISVANTGKFWIVNGYSQFGCGVNQIRTEYPMVRKVFRAVQFAYEGKRIGYPLYGAGLAGGEWNIISDIIDEELEGEDHTLVKFDRRN